MSDKVYLIQSPVHKWRVWKTTIPTPMPEWQRFRDSKNHYPIIVPPTQGDRMDYITNDEKIERGYNYRVKGWIILIVEGSINKIISKN
jgi:hypothetical protein